MNRIKEIEVSWEEYNQRLADSSRYISSDGSGNYSCSLCDHTWRGYKRYLYWPIFFRWQRKASHKFFNWHGWQLGYEGLEQKVFGWTLHIGPLKICFGSTARLPIKTHYTYRSPVSPQIVAEFDILNAEYLSDAEQ